jgi:ribosomal protein S12 methylthiotransferase accessory factor
MTRRSRPKARLNRSGVAARARCPATTLKFAKRWVGPAGIAEVFDITHLDPLGVPTFVSVRPQARADVFTFGKGKDPIEAEVAAYMEAIEYFFAEPGVANVGTRWGTPRDVTGAATGERAADAILDYAPILHRRAALDAPILLASARDIETADDLTVPAELIYYPAPHVGQSLFGSSTNGLASGNSILEATYHALAELIERDVWSFELVRDCSVLVAPTSLPNEARDIVERAERKGLRLIVRTVQNDYAVPFFAAFLFDPERPCRRFFNGGWGCDLDRSFALMRAVTEAVQSRLAFLHGGRKVPRTGAPPGPADEPEDEARLVARHILGVCDVSSMTSYDDVPVISVPGPLEQRLDLLITRLRRVVATPICRCVLTPADAPLHVVRLVVPLLESFKETRIRVGRRLKSEIETSLRVTGRPRSRPADARSAASRVRPGDRVRPTASGPQVAVVSAAARPPGIRTQGTAADIA